MYTAIRSVHPNKTFQVGHKWAIQFATFCHWQREPLVSHLCGIQVAVACIPYTSDGPWHKIRGRNVLLSQFLAVLRYTSHVHDIHEFLLKHRFHEYTNSILLSFFRNRCTILSKNSSSFSDNVISLSFSILR